MSELQNLEVDQHQLPVHLPVAGEPFFTLVNAYDLEVQNLE